MVIFLKFDVDLVLAAAKKHPPTVFCAVPPIYERTATEAKKRGVDLGSVRFAMSGGMNLPQSTVDLWEGTAGGLLVEGYGMTGQPGELLIRGPQVFQGYWGKPEETAATLLDGGWLRTGDIVTVDEQHNARIVDRVKDLIITGGFNVSPTEVEETPRSHPEVADAAVVGLPRAEGGEDVTAAIVLRHGATLDEAAEKDMRDYCRGRLAAYKVPRRIVAVAELPKSMLGKVLRKQVKEQLARPMTGA